MTTAHTPRRIKRKRTPGWTLAGATTNPLGAVIVDRTSRYGNPFTIALATELGYEQPRMAAVGAFDEWLSGNRDMWQSDEGDRRRERIFSSLHLLRGRDLACTCEEADACHADVLIRRANAVDIDGWVERVRARVARNRDWRGEPPLDPAVLGSRPDTRAYATPEPGCPGLRCSDCEPDEECCEARCGCCPEVDAHDHCRLAPGSEDDSRYCDQHGEGWLEPISDARVAQSVRDELLAAGATPGPDTGGAA